MKVRVKKAPKPKYGPGGKVEEQPFDFFAPVTPYNRYAAVDATGVAPIMPARMTDAPAVAAYKAAKPVDPSADVAFRAARTEAQARKRGIAQRQEAQKAYHEDFPIFEGDMNWQDDWRKRARVAALALDEDTRMFEGQDNPLEILNPIHWIGELGSQLGQAPYEARRTGSNMPYYTALGSGLVQGALGFNPAKQIGKGASWFARGLMPAAEKPLLEKYAADLATKAAPTPPANLRSVEELLATDLGDIDFSRPTTGPVTATFGDVATPQGTPGTVVRNPIYTNEVINAAKKASDDLAWKYGDARGVLRDLEEGEGWKHTPEDVANARRLNYIGEITTEHGIPAAYISELQRLGYPQQKLLQRMGTATENMGSLGRGGEPLVNLAGFDPQMVEQLRPSYNAQVPEAKRSMKGFADWLADYANNQKKGFMKEYSKPVGVDYEQLTHPRTLNAYGGKVRKPRSDRFGSLMGYAGGGKVPCFDCGGTVKRHAFGDKVSPYGPYEEDLPYANTPNLNYGWDPYTDPKVLNADIYENSYGPVLYQQGMSPDDVTNTYGNSPFGQRIGEWTNPTPESYNERSTREYNTIYGPVDQALAASRQPATPGYTPESPVVKPQTINTLSYQPPASPSTPWSAGTPYQFTPREPDFNVNPTSVSESLYRDLAEQNTKDFEARQIAQRNTWGTDPALQDMANIPTMESEKFRFDLNPKPKGQQEILTSSYQLTPWGNPNWKMPANYAGNSGNRNVVDANLKTTMGDVVGDLGTALGTLGPLWSTIKNRRGDKPHSNYYQQFGKEALESNRLAQEASAKAGSAARINARILANTSRAANRGSTSSLNVLRGLDAITNLTNDMSNANIDSTEAQRMIGLLQQRSALQNERDKMVMTGEEARDLGDRRDRDAYYSQLSKNLSDAGTSIQNYGKQLNRQVMNQQEMDLLNMMSRYGFNVRVNNGRLVATNSKGETTDLGS